MRYFAVFVLALGLCHVPLHAAVKAGFVASGSLQLDKKLTEKAKGIRTVFLSVYDPKSSMPMPFGAQKLELTKDAKGKFTKFTLDTTSMMMMGSGELPPVIDIKAKLDKDGSAGPDASGDLVGWARGVHRGAKGLTIKIDHAVP